MDHLVADSYLSYQTNRNPPKETGAPLLCHLRPESHAATAGFAELVTAAVAAAAAPAACPLLRATAAAPPPAAACSVCCAAFPAPSMAAAPSAMRAAASPVLEKEHRNRVNPGCWRPNLPGGVRGR